MCENFKRSRFLAPVMLSDFTKFMPYSINELPMLVGVVPFVIFVAIDEIGKRSLPIPNRPQPLLDLPLQPM